MRPAFGGVLAITFLAPSPTCVCVCVYVLYLRAFGMEAVLPSFYPIARLAKGKFIVLSMV